MVASDWVRARCNDGKVGEGGEGDVSDEISVCSSSACTSAETGSRLFNFPLPLLQSLRAIIRVDAGSQHTGHFSTLLLSAFTLTFAPCLQTNTAVMFRGHHQCAGVK